MIELEVLKKYLQYNPETGTFVWLKSTGKKNLVGGFAGSIDESTGYIRISFQNKVIYAHRLAWFYMTGKWPSYIDHQDRDKLNNKFNNLREVNQSINGMNSSIYRNNNSGYPGVARRI